MLIALKIHLKALKTDITKQRRIFLKMAALGFASFFIVIWKLITGKQESLLERTENLRINTKGLGTGVHLFDRFIVVVSEEQLIVFSNRCTHAGCSINKEAEGQLICTCHGSMFESLTGKAIQGPAKKELVRIPFIEVKNTDEIIIKI